MFYKKPDIQYTNTSSEKLMNRWICHAGEAIYPDHEDMPGFHRERHGKVIDQFRKDASWPIWVAVSAGATVFQLSPILTVGIPLPASRLSKKMRDRHAYRILTHRAYLVRQSTFILKMMVGMAWSKDGPIREKFGYKPYPNDPLTWRTS